MSFVPQPPVGSVDVVLRVDYRYGLVDPIQWPQLFSVQYDYLCAVLRRVPPNDQYAPMWWSPDEATDFEIVQGSMFKTLGTLKEVALGPLMGLVTRLYLDSITSKYIDDRLRWLRTAMVHAADRLRHFPSTFRDAAMQVRETQRYWLMTHAFIHYYDIYVPRQNAVLPCAVEPGLMGAFTTDPGVVQKLFQAGVPVWFVRPDISLLSDARVGQVVRLTLPSELSTEVGAEYGHVLFRGLAGARHIAATARGGHTYFDISRAPLLAVDTDRGYAAPVTQKEFIGYRSGQMIAPQAVQTSSQSSESSHRSGGVLRRRPRGRGGHGRGGFLSCLCCVQVADFVIQVPSLIPVRSVVSTNSKSSSIHGCPRNSHAGVQPWQVSISRVPHAQIAKYGAIGSLNLLYFFVLKLRTGGIDT